MRITKTCILLIAAVALLATFPIHAADKTQIIATDTIDPLGLLGAPIGVWLAPGVITCPGDQPTGTFPPCPTGSRTKARAVINRYPISSADRRLVGMQTADINYDLDSNSEGHYWGKWTIVLEDGGVWEGQWSGTFSNVGGGVLLGTSKGELHGTGGSVDGMLLKTESLITLYFGGLAATGIHTGYILDPHAKK